MAAPTEIVFQIEQPDFAGAPRVEEHFPVPDGRLTEAREIARRLMVTGK